MSRSGPTPERPSLSADQNAGTSLPIGVTTPVPVTTTRLDPATEIAPFQENASPQLARAFAGQTKPLPLTTSRERSWILTGSSITEEHP